MATQGTTLTFAATCPVGQVRFNFHLPYSNFRLPLKNCMFYNISFKTKWNMVLACESIFSRTSLDGRPRNVHTLSKVNLKYTKRTFPVGQARCSFHLPHSYNLQILLARGNGASTNVEPCNILNTCNVSPDEVFIIFWIETLMDILGLDCVCLYSIHLQFPHCFLITIAAVS